MIFLSWLSWFWIFVEYVYNGRLGGLICIGSKVWLLNDNLLHCILILVNRLCLLLLVHGLKIWKIIFDLSVHTYCLVLRKVTLRNIPKLGRRDCQHFGIDIDITVTGRRITTSPKCGRLLKLKAHLRNFCVIQLCVVVCSMDVLAIRCRRRLTLPSSQRLGIWLFMNIYNRIVLILDSQIWNRAWILSVVGHMWRFTLSSLSTVFLDSDCGRRFGFQRLSGNGVQVMSAGGFDVGGGSGLIFRVLDWCWAFHGKEWPLTNPIQLIHLILKGPPVLSL